MLKVAPLIHSRTLRCDFNPGFLVRPNDFTDSDAKIIHKRILEATASIDSMQGFRWIVFHEGKFCVAGAVCILKNLASKCDIPTEDEKFFFDIRQRSTYAFIGGSIQSDDGAIPEISYQQLWDWYVTNVSDIWERTVVETQKTDYLQVPFYEPNTMIPNNGEIINEVTFYESSEARDLILFYYYLKKAVTGQNISYCSNLLNFRDVERCSYQAVTTSNNVINRLRAKGNVIHQEINDTLQECDWNLVIGKLREMKNEFDHDGSVYLVLDDKRGTQIEFPIGLDNIILPNDDEIKIRSAQFKASDSGIRNFFKKFKKD